jgi:predicted RNA-binding protein YlxR (DUF448 family)
MTQYPVRTCFVCNKKLSKKELIRFVIKRGKLILDPLSGLGGRGWYLWYNKTCFKNLADKNKIRIKQCVGAEEIEKFVGDFELEVFSQCQKG